MHEHGRDGTEIHGQRLRSQAEARLADSLSEESAMRSPEATLHELRVHQIELEMQNEELRRAQTELADSRDRFAALYEFAPVGYLSLTRAGVISKINLTGAALLATERKKLLQRRFANFVDAPDRDRWHRRFMTGMRQADEGSKTIELALRRGDGAILNARLDCCRVMSDGAPTLLITLTDVTERQVAQERLGESYQLEMVREQEQKRIARELHDEMGAVLTALHMKISMLAEHPPAATGELVAELQEAEKLVTGGIHALRRIVAELRPSELDQVGLTFAIERHVEEFEKHTGIECDLRLPPEDLALNGNRAAAIFRIVQEALTNVAKHAQASKINIVLSDWNKSLVLTIKDNGMGFAPDPRKTTSFGLLGIKERAAMVGGKALITSQPGKGTTVRITLPQ